MATTQSNSPLHSPQEDHRRLAAKLADSCVNPSYMADLWAIYFDRFVEVLDAQEVRQ